MILKNASVLTDSFLFEKLDIRIGNGVIAELGTSLAGEDSFDAQGLCILPGLIDIHTHGCVGHDACDSDPEGFRAMSDFYASQGVTSFLFTTMSYREDKLSSILASISGFIGSNLPGAYAHGVYLEGPFFNPAKKGAQDGANLTSPAAPMFRRLQAASGDNIRIVAVAPELPGSLPFIRELSEEVRITLAHTGADYDTACAAYREGAVSATHLFNAMPPFSHRAPGVVGAAFDKATFAELICDGIHLHPSVVRMAFRTLGPERVILVSDSMMAAGMPDGNYSLGGQPVLVQDGRAKLSDGTIAGSAANLMGCVRDAISFGISPETAVRAASLNPARLAGVDRDTGSIKVGKRADLAAVNRDFTVNSVWIQGERLIQ